MLDSRSAKINTEDFKLVCDPSYVYRSGLFTGRGSQPQALSFLCVKARAGALLKNINKVKTLSDGVIISKNQSSVVGILRDFTLFISAGDWNSPNTANPNPNPNPDLAFQ